MKEELKEWYSPNLSKDIKTLVFGHSGSPIILFPTSMGSYYETKDFKLLESIQGFVDDGKVKD
jgi:esterase/lipase superfamily enzyme